MFCYTEPEFSVDISKSSAKVGPVTIEIFAAVLWSLKHLQYCQMHLTALSHCIADYIQALGGRPPQYVPPLSSLRGRRSASHRRAERACRVQTAT